MKIVADAHIPYIKSFFQHAGELILKPGRTITAKEVKDADILLVRSITRVDQALLGESRVKFVGSVTAGTDHLDVDWLDQAQIKWQRASGFNAPPVADYVVSVIAYLQQRHMLPKKPRVAVVGVGAVGKLVLDRLHVLGYEVLLCDPIRAANEPQFSGVNFAELKEVDMIALHVPLTQHGAHATHHFINKDFLARQKTGCVLLNASRGAVIHSKDLIAAGQHLTWCFDVWEHEPNIDQAILARATIASPHIAGYSAESKLRGIQMIYDGLLVARVIAPADISPIDLGGQTVVLDDKTYSWQEILLAIFNPGVITEEMQRMLLTSDERGSAFDALRNQFVDHHEFAYTKVAANVREADKKILHAFGVLIQPM